VENINKWQRYEKDAPLKYPREDFSKFNYYTLDLVGVKYIIQVGISTDTGKEVFYTVFDMKKT
jgi:hypothetical protein